MLLQQFQKNIKINFSFLQLSQQLLLAVSGGIDSVVMTDLFYKSNFDFAIAHCNFQLREEESERDEAFVQSVAEGYNKKIFINRFDTKKYADKNKISIQEAARNLRYDWFNKLNPGFLATAHNADDNIETALMFFFRGSGIQGLTGIPQYDKERKIIRPLLFASREEIFNYAKSNNIHWVEDSSNLTEEYTRNFLRNKIIPEIQQYFPAVKKNIADNLKRLSETEQLYRQAIHHHKKKLCVFKHDEIHIPILKLEKVKPLDTIIWEIFKAYNFHPNQIDEIKKLFAADNSSYIQSSTHRIIKNRNWIILAPNKTEESSHILIEENTTEIKFKDGILLFEKLSISGFKLQALHNVAQLDAKHIQFPLLLRKWKTGDYFYPLGMNKKKKLSRFFIDHKLSALQKEKIWVLEMNKKIIWIINYRIDERFKITAATKEIFKIEFVSV